MPAEVALPYQFRTPLVTERLLLRLMTRDDVDAVYAYQSRADVCRYLLFEPRDREQVAVKVAEHAVADTLDADGSYLQLALELRSVPPERDDPREPAKVGSSGAGRVIGDSYFTIVSREHARGEIGWTMHPDFTGQGYASEAAAAVLDLAFDTLGLHRVVAELDVRNDASVALCRRLGMREEAHFVRDMWFKGDWSDTGVYAILAEEWRGIRA